jgi:transcriptional regulator with XRE-family HTH domain
MPRIEEKRHVFAGKRLQIARTQYGLSQEELAKKILFTAKSVGKWERHGVPTSKLKIIADFFSLPMAFFMDSHLKKNEFVNALLIRMEDKEASLSGYIVEVLEEEIPETNEEAEQPSSMRNKELDNLIIQETVCNTEKKIDQPPSSENKSDNSENSSFEDMEALQENSKPSIFDTLNPLRIQKRSRFESLIGEESKALKALKAFREANPELNNDEDSKIVYHNGVYCIRHRAKKYDNEEQEEVTGNKEEEPDIEKKEKNCSMETMLEAKSFKRTEQKNTCHNVDAAVEHALKNMIKHAKKVESEKQEEATSNTEKKSDKPDEAPYKSNYKLLKKDPDPTLNGIDPFETLNVPTYLNGLGKDLRRENRKTGDTARRLKAESEEVYRDEIKNFLMKKDILIKND